MNYAEFYQILTEAEWRVANVSDAGVRERSAETVALCKERMAREGLTRDALIKLAAEDLED